MADRDLQHDTAYALALHLLGVFEPLVRAEERSDAFRECYDAAKAALEAYEQLAGRPRRSDFTSRN